MEREAFAPFAWMLIARELCRAGGVRKGLYCNLMSGLKCEVLGLVSGLQWHPCNNCGKNKWEGNEKT